jgi:hypothetical protein
MGTCQTGVTTPQSPCVINGGGCSIDVGLACNAATGVCEAAHLATPGEACGIVADQSTPCALGSCIQGVCVARPTRYDPCEIGGPSCTTPSVCIATADGGTAGTCQLRGSAVCN